MPFNSIGQQLAKTIRIRLRDDQSGGICIGNGVDLNPGDEADVPSAIAHQLLGCGRAVRVVAEPESAESAADSDIEAPVVPEARDPKVTRRRSS